MGKAKAAERQFKCCYAGFKCDCVAFKWFFLDESGKAERKCSYAAFKWFK